MHQTRRGLMRTGVRLTAAGAVVSTAGCLRQIPVVGPLIAGPPLSPNAWVGAPDLFGDSDHDTFYYAHVEEILTHEEHLADAYEEQLTEPDDGTVLAAANVEPETMTAALTYATRSASVSVGQATFTRSEVIGDLEAEGFEDGGTYKGYTVMTAADDSSFAGKAAAVTGDKIIAGGRTAESDPDDVVETAIDVGAGDGDRYVDESDDMRTLVDTLGIGSFVFAGTHPETETTNDERGDFAGEVANGTRYDINGETTEMRSVRLFSTAGQVDVADVEDYVTAREDVDRSVLSEADRTSVSKNGRAAVITATLPTDELFAEN